MIRAGEIYFVDFEEGGSRPAIVASREKLNRGTYVLVVPCTSARFAIRRELPNCLVLRAGEFGLTTDCVAQCENIVSMERTRLDLIRGPIGKLDEARMRNLVKAIGYVIESDCEHI